MVQDPARGSLAAANLARWSRRASAPVAVMTVAAASFWLSPIAMDGATPRGGAPSPAVSSGLVDIPSHNRLYRATLIPSPVSVALDRPLAWTMELRTEAGTPVQGATFELESWMPDSHRVSAVHPRAAAYRRAGSYRVEGLYFDRPGWWNVKLRVSAASGTDSLAFNLILSSR